MKIYLDFNSTSPLKTSVKETMNNAMNFYGNDSSIHYFGRKIKNYIEDCRDNIANYFNLINNKIIFTASATEAAAIIMRSIVNNSLVLVSAIEHSCITMSSNNYEYIPVTKSGIIDLVWLEYRLQQDPVPEFIAVMMVNNETGVIQPMSQIVSLSHKYNVRVICDLVQAIGKIKIDLKVIPVDIAIMTTHKCGGPVGVGALLLNNYHDKINALIPGYQEFGLRGGTANFIGIMGMNEAINSINLADNARIKKLNLHLEKKLLSIVPDCKIWSNDEDRVVNTTSFWCPGINANEQVMIADMNNIAISSGSACSSGQVNFSHVIKAMISSGDRLDCDHNYYSNAPSETIRISTGWNSSMTEIEYFLSFYEKTILSLLTNNKVL